MPTIDEIERELEQTRLEREMTRKARENLAAKRNQLDTMEKIEKRIDSTREQIQQIQAARNEMRERRGNSTITPSSTVINAQECDQYKRTMEALMKHSKTLQSGKADLEQKLNQCTSLVSDLQNGISKQLDQCERDTSKYSVDKQALIKAKSDLEKQIEKYRTELSKRDSLISELNSRLNNVQNNLYHVQNNQGLSKQDVNREMGRLAQEINVVSRQLQECRETSTKYHGMYDETMKRLEINRRDYEQRVRELQDRLDTRVRTPVSLVDVRIPKPVRITRKKSKKVTRKNKKSNKKNSKSKSNKKKTLVKSRRKRS